MHFAQVLYFASARPTKSNFHWLIPCMLRPDVIVVILVQCPIVRHLFAIVLPSVLPNGFLFAFLALGLPAVWTFRPPMKLGQRQLFITCSALFSFNLAQNNSF
jgi:hypothetical protein